MILFPSCFREHVTPRAVPGINRGGWDVQRDNPNGTATVLAAGLPPQQARDMAEQMRQDEMRADAQRRHSH